MSKDKVEVIYLTYNELIAVEKLCKTALSLKGQHRISYGTEHIKSAIRKLEAKASEVYDAKYGED